MYYSFFISDTHFGHTNILSFKDNNGELIRGQLFSTIEEHDEFIIDNWNKVVRKVDTVYHLGDVAINRRCLITLNRLNGRKILIRGNHDIFKLKDYIPYFEDIRAYKVFTEYGIVCSHIPIHPNELKGRYRFNVHGHLHEKFIADERYLNVCVEQTDYKPVSFEQILEHFKL